MALKILSVNVNGIRSEVKRRAVFNYVWQRADIACIQETHSKPEDEQTWKMQWGGDILFSHGQSNSRGVAIIISRRLSQGKVVTLLERDNDGRRISINIKFQEKQFTIVNLYAPE